MQQTLNHQLIFHSPSAFDLYLFTMHLNSSLLFLLLPLLLNASPNDAGKPVSGMVLPTNLEAAKQTFPVEPPLEDLPLRARQDEGSKEPLMYVATLPEPKAGDDPFVKETTEFFRVRSLDFDTNIVILTDWEDKVAAWAGIMPLNQTALGEIKSRKGIKEVFETSRGKRRLAMPKASRREVADLNTDAGFDKRAPGPSGWYKQEFTLDINSFNLKVVSQFA
jgi:hypothetical protein